jgi:Ca2+/H+ antiporter
MQVCTISWTWIAQPRHAIALVIVHSRHSWQRCLACHRDLGCNEEPHLSLSIAIGSSVQVALFVAPLIVLASFIVGPQPMDLLFGKGLVLAVLLAVLITGQIAGDGQCDWLKGIQLLAVYLILGLAFFLTPQV